MTETSAQISVIIHFLNAAKYLSQAIDSVLRQTFMDWELILVDGGSTDASVVIARRYQAERPDQIRILEHRGATTLGIFSSRLWGAESANAPILALLDSDDEWHPQFLERHYAIYQYVFAQRPGMVYCPVTYWWEDAASAVQSYVQPVPPPGLHEPPDLLIPFLEENYQRSAANSAVMIARELVLQARSLIGTANEGMAEDQYLWSCLLTQMPVFVSPEPLARYRQWAGSTCATTLKRDQAITLRRTHLRWLREHLIASYHGTQRDALLVQLEAIIAQECPERAEKQTTSNKSPIVPMAALPCNLLQKLRPFPSLIRARLRSMIGIRPLSLQWGADRGMPILRYYTEEFLHEYASDIRGQCLEFQEDTYSKRFGKERVRNVEILHHDGNNPNATLIADLTRPNSLPSEQFDCILCTFVLHVIFDVERAVSEIFRLLKSGGVLLVVVPHISMCDPQAGELWRFTPEGLRRLLANIFGTENVTIRAYGNALTAAGNVRGLTAHEFMKHELQAHDERFASAVCARAVRTTAVH